MRTLVYFVGTTLDGYIAGPNGETDFFPITDDLVSWMVDQYPETLPTHIRRHLGIDHRENRVFDTVVMGRRTFEPALAVPTTSPYGHLRQYVVSRTLQLTDTPVHIERGDALATLRRLKEEPSDKSIWLCGGGSLAGSALPEIDQILLKRYPVVAGAGIRLFESEFNPHPFTATQVIQFPDGTDVTRLTRAS